MAFTVLNIVEGTVTKLWRMAFIVLNIVEGTVTKLWRIAFIVLNIVEATVKLLNNLHIPNVLKRTAKQIGLKFGSVCLSATVKDSSQNCR